jgi:hypothetical protein
MQMLYVLIDRGREELADPGSVPEELAATIGGGIYNRMRMQLTAEPDNPGRWDPIVPELMYSVIEPYLGTEAALEELTTPRPRPPVLPARR